MKSNKDKALETLAEYLQGIYKIDKLFEPSVKKNDDMMTARQMYMYLAITFDLKDNHKELMDYLKATYGMTYSLRAVIYSANIFADKIVDSISLSAKYKAASEYLRSVYVKAR